MSCVVGHIVCCCCWGYVCIVMEAIIGCCVIKAGCTTLFACHTGVHVCWTVPIAKALALVYPTRPLLDGATMRPLSKGLPPVPTCVVAL